MTLERVLILSAILFSIGLYGVLTKRNAITMLMAIELMFNGVILAAVAAARYVTPAGLRVDPSSTADTVAQFVLTGQVFAMFIIAVAAAEVSFGNCYYHCRLQGKAHSGRNTGQLDEAVTLCGLIT